jgi:replicative DNA helicase
MKNNVNFGKFGRSFQEGLCQLLLQDRPFSDQMFEVLDISFLEYNYLRLFVEEIKNYKNKYKVHPTYKTMTTIIRSMEHDNEALLKQLRDYYARVQSTEVDGPEYIKETSLEFCKKQKLKEAMLKSVDLLQASSFDEISKIINNALTLGLSPDHGYDYLKDFEKRFEFKHRDPVSTGWSEVNAICRGGLGKGELGVVIAPTGAGKTMVLVHLGASALKHGKTVVHYTLELGDTIIANRYDSCLTKVPLDSLVTFKELIYEAVKELEGSLIVKEYSTKSATTNTIRNHLEKLKVKGIEPDMVIIDYGDLLRPISDKNEKRHELESIYEEMRAIAQDFDCPVWTASQTNRSGLNAEVITMESISEAFSKCFVADFIFSVSRTVEDKAANSGRVYVAKNRNGPDGLIYPIFMDTSKVSINVLPLNTNAEATTNTKNQSELLKEKWKKFKESRET